MMALKKSMVSLDTPGVEIRGLRTEMGKNEQAYCRLEKRIDRRQRIQQLSGGVA
jgi:hypothetical protein